MTDKYLQSAQQNWENDGIAFYKGANTYAFMYAFLGLFDELESNLQEVKDGHQLATATGDELDKIGYMVGLNRKSGESDEKFRVRIQTRFRVNFTGSSYDEITEFITTIMNVSPDTIDFVTNYSGEPGTLTVQGTGDVFSQSILTPSEISDFASQVAPAAHRVVLEEQGSFALIGDQDPVQDYDTGLTGDSDLTKGGKLSGDI